MRRLIASLVLVAGCTDESTYLTVTVDRRAAVHDAANLKVTLSNAGSMRTDDLDLDGKSFPVTFTLSAPGRSGDLGIGIDALDSTGTLVGRGAGATKLDEMTATVTLDSADFVVNSEYANDQFLTSDYEAVGFQLAAIANGQWMASFRDECAASTSNCAIYGRRFDSTGLPVFSELGAGNIQFELSTNPTTTGAMPAVASSGLNTLAFWDFTESSGGARGVACRAVNEMGASPANQLTIQAEAADVVSATGLSNSNFAVTWQMFMTSTYVTRAAIVTPGCTVVGSVQTLSTTTGAFGATRSNVAVNGSTILWSWTVDEGNTAPNLGTSLWVKTSTLAPAFGTEMRLLDSTPGQTIEHVRVTPWNQGFAIAVRWASRQVDGPGKIELYRANLQGQLMGQPILITDESRSDFASNKGFSIALRPDNALLVVWHVCETGAGLCDVFGRILRPTGAAVGEPFVIPTSTASEQINPSVIALSDSFVAAWNDSSGEAPDRAGTAVRARVLTPVYDDARGVHGATCGAAAPGAPDCGEGLACAMGTDAIQRCYYVCSPPSCPRGGTCSSADGGLMACTF